LVWCFEVLSRRPDFIVEENTPLFKAWILEHIFVTMTSGEYEMQTRKFSPEDLGFPVSRPRQYVILTKTASLEVMEKFDGPIFESLFFRQRVANGDVFFSQCGGTTERLNYERHLLGKKGLVFKQHKRSGRRWVDMIGSSMKIRFDGYSRLAQQLNIENGIVDVNQTPGHRRHIMNIVPTLLRNSTMAELSTGRVLLPSAHFDVMGLPLHRPPGVEYKLPFAAHLQHVTYKEMKALTGNAMHSAAVGACLAYILCCCKDKRATSSSSSSSASGSIGSCNEA